MASRDLNPMMAQPDCSTIYTYRRPTLHTTSYPSLPPEMHFFSKHKIFEFNPIPKFIYHAVVFQDGDDFYLGHVTDQWAQVEELNKTDPAALMKIPREHIWPLRDDHLTVFDMPDRPDIYVKRPAIYQYNGSEALGVSLLQEAKVCEELIKHPHENVARYLGCIEKENRIMGLCFQKYAETLEDRLFEGREVDIASCQSRLHAGISHLHSLNLIHNDVHSRNVMFLSKENDTPILIDFDSCVAKGGPLPDKRGPLPEGARTAEVENDNYALGLLGK